MNTKIDVLSHAVRVKGDNTIDIDATVALVAERARQYLEAMKGFDGQMYNYVKELLSKQTSRVTQEYIVGRVMQRFNLGSGEDGGIDAAMAAVSAWLDSNTTKDRSIALSGGAFLHSSAGRNGGVCLSSDVLRFSSK